MLDKKALIYIILQTVNHMTSCYKHCQCYFALYLNFTLNLISCTVPLFWNILCIWLTSCSFLIQLYPHYVFELRICFSFFRFWYIFTILKQDFYCKRFLSSLKSVREKLKILLLWIMLWHIYVLFCTVVFIYIQG